MTAKKCPIKGFDDCIEDECKWFKLQWPDEPKPGGLPNKDCAVSLIAEALADISADIVT